MDMLQTVERDMQKVDYNSTPAMIVSAVERLQAEVVNMPQYEPQTNHHFHGGMYCREMFSEEGVLVVGKVHRKEHFFLVASGTVLVTTDDGAKELTAPAMLLSKPGTKRAIFSLTPSVCMTFHVTDATTPEDAEAELVEDDPESPLFGNVLRVGVLT